MRVSELNRIIKPLGWKIKNIEDPAIAHGSDCNVVDCGGQVWGPDCGGNITGLMVERITKQIDVYNLVSSRMAVTHPELDGCWLVTCFIDNHALLRRYFGLEKRRVHIRHLEPCKSTPYANYSSSSAPIEGFDYEVFDGGQWVKLDKHYPWSFNIRAYRITGIKPGYSLCAEGGER